MKELPASTLKDLFEASCLPLLKELRVDGVSMSLMASTSVQTFGYASNDTARRIDELQFELGEGPRLVATRTTQPILLPTLSAADHALWPYFGAALQNLDVSELFIYPMMLGPRFLGIIELHSRAQTDFITHHTSAAATLVAQAASTIQGGFFILGPEERADLLETDPATLSRAIHQATGMVLVQANTGIEDALELLKAHAFAHSLTLRETAHAVLTRQLNFST